MEPMASEMIGELKKKYARRGRIIGLLLVVILLMAVSRFI